MQVSAINAIGALAPSRSTAPAQPAESASEGNGNAARRVEQKQNTGPRTAPQTGQGVGGNQETGPNGLTEAQQERVRELRQRDREVRQHENAHRNAGAGIAGPPRYQTVRGPDGQQYAVSGEVQIDTSEVPNDPEATARKMEQVIRAALAPAEPSPQDRRVAAEARQTKTEAESEARQLRAEERNAGGPASGPNMLQASQAGETEDPEGVDINGGGVARAAATAYAQAAGRTSEDARSVFA